MRCRNIKFTPTLNMINPEYQKMEACRGPDALIPAAYGGQLVFETFMRGKATVVSEWENLVEFSGNFNKRPAAAGKVTNATASTLVGLTADIGAYVVGDAIMVTGTATDTQIRFITRVQDGVPTGPDTTLDISPDWADIPVSTDSVVACSTWTPGVGESGDIGGGGTQDRKRMGIVGGCFFYLA